MLVLEFYMPRVQRKLLFWGDFQEEKRERLTSCHQVTLWGLGLTEGGSPSCLVACGDAASQVPELPVPRWWQRTRQEHAVADSAPKRYMARSPLAVQMEEN